MLYRIWLLEELILEGMCRIMRKTKLLPTSSGSSQSFGQKMTYVEFRDAFQVLASAVTAQTNSDVAVLVRPNVGTVASSLRDFTKTNPLEFYGLKV